MILDPFDLFPPLVQDCELIKPSAPGLPSEVLAVLRVIVKAQTASDDFTDYNSRNLQCRFHIKTSTLPDVYRADPDGLLGLNLRFTPEGRQWRINHVSRGDDFTTGKTPFLTVMCNVAGRRSA